MPVEEAEAASVETTGMMSNMLGFTGLPQNPINFAPADGLPQNPINSGRGGQNGGLFPFLYADPNATGDQEAEPPVDQDAMQEDAEYD